MRAQVYFKETKYDLVNISNAEIYTIFEKQLHQCKRFTRICDCEVKL